MGRRRRISEIMAKVREGRRLTADEREYLSRYLRRVRPGGESGRSSRSKRRTSISSIMSKVARGIELTEREEDVLSRYLRRVR